MNVLQATTAFAPAAAGLQPTRPLRLPRWIRMLLPPQRIPAELLDRSTGLYNRAGLFAAANEMIHSARASANASMVIVEFGDLREVCDIYGDAIARRVVARIVRRLRRVAGAHGVVGRTGPAQFTVVIPYEGEKVAKCLQRGLGKTACIEFDAGDSEIVLVPDLIVETAEPGDVTAQELYRQMGRQLAHNQEEERRRLHWLASERERHSRPMTDPAA
ncbi:MAG TPA: diguanylate cyclase [Ramlibacter sp.]|nr:diguanylate cyclase [Ramlibacter sp.]